MTHAVEDLFDNLRVSGPVSSLPGSLHSVPAGAKCDEHPQYTAYYRVQGETDSFGAEYAFMCAECYTKHMEYVKAERNSESQCDWCKTMQVGCRSQRDYEEGLGGPVYNVCPRCIAAQNQRAQESLDAYDGEFDFDDRYNDDDDGDDSSYDTMFGDDEDNVLDSHEDKEDAYHATSEDVCIYRSSRRCMMLAPTGGVTLPSLYSAYQRKRMR